MTTVTTIFPRRDLLLSDTLDLLPVRGYHTRAPTPQSVAGERCRGAWVQDAGHAGCRGSTPRGSRLFARWRSWYLVWLITGRSGVQIPPAQLIGAAGSNPGTGLQGYRLHRTHPDGGQDEPRRPDHFGIRRSSALPVRFKTGCIDHDPGCNSSGGSHSFSVNSPIAVFVGEYPFTGFIFSSWNAPRAAILGMQAWARASCWIRFKSQPGDHHRLGPCIRL